MSSPDPLRNYGENEHRQDFKRNKSPEERYMKHTYRKFKKQLSKTIASSKARNAALDKFKK